MINVSDHISNGAKFYIAGISEEHCMRWSELEQKIEQDA